MWNWVAQASELQKQGLPFAVATVTQCSGSTPRGIGAKMIVLPDGKFFGTIGGGHLEQCAIEDAQKCLSEGVSRTHKYPLGAKLGQCCGGVMEVLVEVMGIGPLLYLFGAGHVGQALARTLSGTPFQVHLIDERKEWVESDLLPAEVIRHECEWQDFTRDAFWDEGRVYAAVMTFRHDLDQEIVGELMKKPLKYLGLIGSQSKWERFKDRLGARGFVEQDFARVQCPIGHDIGGGKAPQEIAISIATELLTRHYGKN